MCFRRLLLGVAVLVAPSYGQELPRHGAIGLAVASADTSRPEDPRTNPPTIRTVVPGSAGEVAGLQAGDVLLKLDGVPVTSSTGFAKDIGRRLGGDKVTIDLQRGGSERTVTAVLKPRPFETSPDADVLYQSIEVDGARRRTIVTRPKGTGRRPAVLLVGGLGCYSLDGQLGRPDGYGPLLQRLTQFGFATMRVEKPGEGDSEGPACTDAKATAELEARGYLAGLRALKKYDFVDPARVFVFAHSLGPLVASLTVPQEPVRGFIAAETIGRSWFEYMLGNVRRQAALSGDALDVVDEEVRAHERCLHRFFVEHESQEQVVKAGPACAEIIASFAGVPGPYMQQIGDLNLAKQWKQMDMPVLVIYGTSDPVTSADESRYLVDVINSFHPGRATYLEIPGMGHDFAEFSSQQEFLDRRSAAKPHPYSGRLVDAVLEWLERQAAG